MLIIPASRRPDWHNPPLVTLFLILVNTLIFFGLQTGDERRTEHAYHYYGTSSLPQIELPRYADYLERQGKHGDTAQIRNAVAAGHWKHALRSMENDPDFMERLLTGRIVSTDATDFSTWQRQRKEFARLKNAVLTERFGFKPAQPTLAGFVGNMFLHGSIDHLLGNMAILFMVGYLVEEALGKRRYLSFYLLAGVGATLLDWVVNSERLAPGIGASGAISGVMAMFVALYGLRRIRFFYWAFVYFDFFQAPAIVMLPVWMANEIYQYVFNHGSMVNYMAHLGGFIAGGVLIGQLRLFGKQQIEAPEQEAPVDPLPGKIEHIDTLLGKLHIDEALVALRRLARTYPEELAVLERYVKVARNQPASDDYHQAAAHIFALSDRQPMIDTLVYETYCDYLKNAKPSVRFSVPQLIGLVRRLARSGHAADAEKLLRALTRRAPHESQLPGLLLLVADTFRRQGNTTMCDTMLLRLQQEYPGSEEARSAKALFR